MSRLCWCDEAITTERWTTRKSSSYHRTIVILSSHCRIMSSSSRHRAFNVIAPSTKILMMRQCEIELCDPIQILSSWGIKIANIAEKLNGPLTRQSSYSHIFSKKAYYCLHNTKKKPVVNISKKLLLILFEHILLYTYTNGLGTSSNKLRGLHHKNKQCV